MVQKVTIPEVGVVEFSDSMNPEDIAAAIKLITTGGAAPAPKAPQTPTQKILNSPVGGVIRGLRDLPDAGAQLLTRSLEAVAPAGSAMEQFMKEERRRVEDINRQAELDYQKNWRQGQMKQGEMDVGRIGGNIATAIMPSTAAVKALGLTQAPVRAGAVSGAVGAAMQPVATPESRDLTLSDLVTGAQPQGMSTADFFTQKAAQIGSAAALGAGAGYLGDKLTQAVFGRGTPSQIQQSAAKAAAGGEAGAAEASITATPTVQATGGGVNLGAVTPEANAALTAAQQSILQRGKALGFKTTPAQETGSRSLLQMEARMESSPFTSAPFNAIKQENQRVLNRATAQAIGVKADELSNPVLAQAQRNISAVYNRIATPELKKLDTMTMLNNIDLVDNAFEGLTTQPLKSNIFVKQLQDLAMKGEASGVQLQNLSSKIGKRAKNEMTTAMGDRELGNALFQLKEMVDDALQSGLSQAEQQAFAQARNNYRNLMTIRTSQGVVNPSSGNVSGLNLASALTRKDPKGFVFGGNETPMYEAARFAQAFKPIVGDSGTATRSMEYSPVNVLLSMPTNLAARAYTSAPVTAAASRVSSGAGVAPNALTAAQVAALRKALPVTGGLGIAGLLGQ
jgi:hypothetical protein